MHDSPALHPESPTLESRREIGFAEDPSSWQDAPAEFTDHTLKIQGHPVMEDWEAPYMAHLAQIACSQGGRVLEVGFGMAISAGYIQSWDIDEHLIIEANADVFKRLQTFAKSAQRPVTPLFGFWQDVTPDIPDNSLDGILFDTYPLKQEEVHCNHFPFFAEAHRMLKPGGIFTYYSDEATNFSPIHKAKLHEAGFDNIDSEICLVEPASDCEYWEARSLLSPIIIK